MFTPAQLNLMTRILPSETLFSQSLSLSILLDKGNAGSGNEIDININQLSDKNTILGILEYKDCLFS